MIDDPRVSPLKAGVIREDMLMATSITRAGLPVGEARWFRVTSPEPGRAVCVEVPPPWPEETP